MEIKILKPNSFARDNLIVVSGSLAISLANFLFYPIVARIVGVTTYGDVQFVASLYLQLALIFGCFNVLVVRALVDEKKNDVAARRVAKIYRFVLILTIVLGAIFALSAGFFAQALHFSSPAAFHALGLVLVAGPAISYWAAWYQARKQFGRMVGINLLAAWMRLLIGVPLTLAFGAWGAVVAIGLGQLIAIVVYGLKDRGLPSLIPKSSRSEPGIESSYVILVITMTIGLSVLASFDLVAVKYFSSRMVAGEYSGIATIGRILLFLVIPISTALLPQLILGRQQQNQQLLKRSLMVVTGITALAIIASVFLGSLAVRVVVGSSYLEFASLLPLLMATMGLVGLVTVASNFVVAVGRHAALLLLPLAICVMVVYLGISGHHAPQQILLLEAVVLLVLTPSLLLLGRERV